MLFGETVAVYCENHTEHRDTLCGQNAEFLYVKAGGTYSNHWGLKRLHSNVRTLSARLSKLLQLGTPAFAEYAVLLKDVFRANKFNSAHLHATTIRSTNVNV
jgi:hypothetical protein